MLGFACVVIIVAMIGIGVCKIKNRCFTACYGCILLPTWIAFIAVGGAAFWFSVAGKEIVLEECEKLIENLSADAQSKKGYEGEIISGIGGFLSNIISTITFDDCDSVYTSNLEVNLAVYEAILINKEMCSSNCPCKSTKASDWISQDIKTWGRCRDWDFTGNVETY